MEIVPSVPWGHKRSLMRGTDLSFFCRVLPKGGRRPKAIYHTRVSRLEGLTSWLQSHFSDILSYIVQHLVQELKMRRKVKLHQFAIIVNMGSVVGCSTASLEILEFPPDTTWSPEASRDDSWRSFRATAPTSPMFGSCRTSMVLFSQICLRKPGSARIQLAATSCFWGFTPRIWGWSKSMGPWNKHHWQLKTT